MTVLAGAVLALGLGAAAAPAAQAADTDANLELLDGIPGSWGEGSPAQYLIGARNHGPAESTNWSVTLTVSDLVTFDPASLETEGSGTCSFSAQEVTCSGDTLAVDESFSARFDGIPNRAGTGTFTVGVSGDEVDPQPVGDTRSGTFEVNPVDEPDPAGSGDWGTTGSDLMAPGTSGYYDLAFTCLSAEGCDYGPGITITDQAHPNALFGAGTNNLYINDQTNVGDCQVSESAINCAVTETGHADQGDVLSSAGINYRVTGAAPADTQMFAQTIAFPDDWTGNVPSNDVYPISTPPEVGASIVSWQAGAGIGGLALLLGGGALLLRRQRSSEPVAA